MYRWLLRIKLLCARPLEQIAQSHTKKTILLKALFDAKVTAQGELCLKSGGEKMCRRETKVTGIQLIV